MSSKEIVAEKAFGKWLPEDVCYWKLMFIGVFGAPDRIILGDGYFYMIEWKREGKELRSSQIFVHKILEKAGIHVHVCKTVLEAMNIHEMEKLYL